jgi:hypothetical protein
MDEPVMLRENGLYWVRHDEEPAVWTIGQWQADASGWWLLSSEVLYLDCDMAEIGERLPEHV